jgi:multicomponent Na+:H+ antiporter subunit E
VSRLAAAAVLLAATYLLALASVDPVDVATALVVGVALLVGFRRFLFVERPQGGPSLLTRMLAFPLFAAAVIVDITRGTWEVALIVLHVRPLRSPGIVAIPFGGRTPLGAAVTALVATISPGEVLVDLDRERRVMFLHVINASDPDGVRRKHEAFYERFQRRVFP